MAFKDHEPLKPNYKRRPAKDIQVELRQVPKFDESHSATFAEDFESLADWAGGSIAGTSHHESMWAIFCEDEKGTAMAVAQGWWIGITSEGKLLVEPTLNDVLIEADLVEIKTPEVAEGDVREISVDDLAELLVLLQVPSSLGRLGAAVDPLARIRQKLGLFGYPNTEEVAAVLRNTEMR